MERSCPATAATICRSPEGDEDSTQVSRATATLVDFLNCFSSTTFPTSVDSPKPIMTKSAPDRLGRFLTRSKCRGVRKRSDRNFCFEPDTKEYTSVGWVAGVELELLT